MRTDGTGSASAVTREPITRPRAALAPSVSLRSPDAIRDALYETLADLIAAHERWLWQRKTTDSSRDPECVYHLDASEALREFAEIVLGPEVVRGRGWALP